MMQNLDRCNECQRGRMRIYKTRTVGSSRTRFLKCDVCGATGKETFKVDHLGRVVISPVVTSRGTGYQQAAAATE